MSENEQKPIDPDIKVETLAEKIAQLIGMKPHQANMVKFLAVALALGILFMNAGALFGVTDRPSDPAATEIVASPGAPQDELTRMEGDLGRTLERILSQITGAGEVRVTVMLLAGPTITTVADHRTDKTHTTESAADGSKREIVAENVTRTNVVTKSGNTDTPAVMKKDRAEIAGVLIVADGAGSVSVRAKLHSAAMTALGIPAHRIQVVAAKER